MKIGKDDITTLAYIPLHYGSDYLKCVIDSIYDSVDTILILYTKQPSYGHVGSIPNPDSEDRLKAICRPYSKIVWVDVTGVNGEGNHREMAIRYARKCVNSKTGKNYDLVFAVDADEVWNSDLLPEALHAAYNSGFYNHAIGGDRWWHFWKGIEEVNRDGFYPVRIANLNNNVVNQKIIHVGEIYHMGYAISREAMEYKLSCHGHKGEIKSSWFLDKWLNYQRGKTTHLHPASQDVWIQTQDFTGTLPKQLIEASKCN